jgi:hypothetical protein
MTQDEALREVKWRLRTLEGTDEEFRALLHRLDEDNLFHFDMYYLNYLSLFRDSLPLSRIREIARDAARSKVWGGWEHSRYILRLLLEPPWDWQPGLAGWDLKRVGELLALGRGLMICTMHYGPFRHVLTDLPQAGIPVRIGLDSPMTRRFRWLVRKGLDLWDTQAAGKCEKTPFLALAELHDVEEEKNATVALMNSLRGNGVVIFILDGNSGMDGQHGQSNTVPVNLLGCRMTARTGAVQMALAAGSPLLFLLAEPGPEGRHSIGFAEEYIPEGRVKPTARRALAEDLVRNMYTRLEERLKLHPENWSNSCFLHAWRSRFVPKPPAMADADASVAGASLNQGYRFRFNDRRVAPVLPRSSKIGTVLVDIDTLSVFRMGDSLQPLFAGLSSPAGVDREWIRSCGLDYDAVVGVLAKLQRRSLVSAASAEPLSAEN